MPFGFDLPGPSIPMPPALREFLGLDDDEKETKHDYGRSRRSDANRAKSFEGRERNARRGSDPFVGPSIDPITLQDIIDSLGGPVGAGGGIPLPDRNAFIAPFNNAEQATRNVHAQVIPTIDNIFATLQTGMGQQEQQFSDRMAALAASAGQQQQAAAAALPAPQQAIAVDPSQVVGSLAAELQQANVANTQSQQAANQADLAMLNEIAAMGQADSASVQQSAQAVGAGARANADAQLQQALNAIGMGRAQAEADFASQAAQAAAQNAALSNDAARTNMDMRRMAMEEWDRINGDILKRASASFDTGIRALEAEDNDLYNATLDIIDATGSKRGESNYRVASQTIRQNVESGAITPEDGASLQEWIRKYYIGGKDEIDPQAFVRMGGDPAYLQSLGI